MSINMQNIPEQLSDLKLYIQRMLPSLKKSEWEKGEAEHVSIANTFALSKIVQMQSQKEFKPINAHLTLLFHTLSNVQKPSNPIAIAQNQIIAGLITNRMKEIFFAQSKEKGNEQCPLVMLGKGIRDVVESTKDYGTASPEDNNGIEGPNGLAQEAKTLNLRLEDDVS